MREPLSRIRIERPLPAPLLDGFDVRTLHVGRVYDVDERLARYLIVAGYAVPIHADNRAGGGGKKRRS